MTPADMRNEALTRVAESDRLFEIVQRPGWGTLEMSPEQQHMHRAVSHLRQTAIVFAVVSREDS